ncbi:hypothetical protein [Azotosporobacter soli]|uniref:hypothetical protein n=1 Tax=Azotosporobacter soli TaxID=3055040 RepID=UPI0031FEC7B9
MKKSMLFIFFLVASLAAYAYHSTLAYDQRSAANLSAYCNIDFRSVLEPQTNQITGATLSIVDFRYAAPPLESFFRITVDGQSYTLTAVSISARPPSYSPDGLASGKSLQHTNTLFVAFPRPVLAAIAQAQTVSVSFKYADSASPIELPLSAVDLQYWKKQLPAF